MNTASDTHENYASLLSILKHQDAIVIAGTGVTAATVPSNSLVRSWPALLENGVQFCLKYGQSRSELSEQCRSFNQSINADMNTLLRIGDEIQAYLNQHGLMIDWLNSIFSDLSKEDERLIRAIQQLGIPVATTNYDHLIEDITRLDAISWKDVPKLHAFLRGGDKTILHLHGHYRDATSIILGSESYASLLEQEFAQFAEQSLFARSNVIFIGFGDSTKDPNFSRLLTWAKRYLTATNIYRIVRESELDKLRVEHEQSNYNIRLVSYGQNYDQLAPFLEALASQLPVHPPIPKNLPGCPDCVGRGQLIEDVAANLIDLTTKPVCLLGAGGIGKTNLILNALYHRKVAARFSERRYFIRCETATNTEALWNTVLTTLGVPRNSQLNLQEQVEYSLAQHPTLLVFDNFETLYQAESRLLDDALLRLRKIDTLKLAVTNRGREKPGLKMGWEPFMVTHLDKDQAKALFVNLTDDTYTADPVLPTLLKAVDYLPLAITLLAKRTEDYPTLQNLYQQWEKKKTDLLTLESDDKDLSLEASILLSFESPRLSDTAREIFKAFCYLPGGLNRDDLNKAFPDDEESINRLLKTLLVEEDAAERVRVLAPVRELMLAKFPANPAYISSLTRTVLDIAAENGHRIITEGGVFHRIEAEWSNLETIFNNCEYDEKLIETLGKLMTFSHFSGVSLTVFLKKALISSKANKWQLLQALCLKNLGVTSSWKSDHQQAENYLKEALPLFISLRAWHGVANCLVGLGKLAIRESKYPLTEFYYEHALLLYKKVGDLQGEAHCLGNLGDVALYNSENQQAKDYYKQALPLHQKAGDLLGKANCLRSLGGIAHAESDNRGAKDYYEQALPLYEQVGTLQGIANCRIGLGEIAFEEGNNQQAKDYYEQAVSLYKKIGYLQGEANCMMKLGEVEFAESDIIGGNRQYQDAIKIFQHINNPYSIGEAYLSWSNHQNNEELCNQYRCAAKKAWEGAGLYKLIDEYGLISAC